MKKISESKIFTLILILSFVVIFVCLGACTAKETNIIPTDTLPGTESSSEETTAPVTEAEKEVAFKSEYKPYKAIDAEGSEVALSQVYGSSYATYGGSLTFEGDRFNLSVGVSNGKTAGTIEVGADSQLTFNYDSGKIVSAEIVSAFDGVVEEIMVEQSDYFVYFK